MIMASSSGSSMTLRGDSSDADDFFLPRDIIPFRSLEGKAHIKVKNRRMRYLELHPDYFSSSLELADPLSYDRLIRRYQTPAEREAEGRRKGYSGVLEADLWRSEAKIKALSDPSSVSMLTYRRGEDGQILTEEKDEVPIDKEDGLRRWHEEMELRFLKGEDEDFDYEKVDNNEEYDDRRVEEREEEEKWFEEEEPNWLVESEHGSENELIRGETGIQDY